MAQHTEVHFVDDLDGSKAVGTVTFSLENRAYEIDLSDENADKLHEALAPFIEHGRKAASAPIASARGRRSGNGDSGGSAADRRRQLAAIREWARQNGLSVSDRGRVSQEVLRAFQAAH